MSSNLLSVRIWLTQIVVIFVCNSVIESKVEFCAEMPFDAVFSDHNNRPLFVRNGWIWSYDQKYKNISAPSKQDPKDLFQIKSMAYISDIPPCETSTNCADMEKAKGLVIMLYEKPNKAFAGDYQVKRVVGGTGTAISDSASLPYGLRIKGNVFSTEETFWPKEVIENVDQIDKKNTIIVFSQFSYELIILVSGQSKAWLCFNRLDPSKTWRDDWKCQTVGHDWQYVGAFLMTNSIYVLAVKESNNRLFTISKDHELIDTSISVLSYFGCGKKSQTFMAGGSDADELKSSGNSFWIWIFVVCAAVVCLIGVFALIFVYGVRKKDGDDSKKQLDPNAKVKPLPKIKDSKGNEVDQARIGTLDANVHWDVVLATPSTDVEDGAAPKHNPNNKKTKP